MSLPFKNIKNESFFHHRKIPQYLATIAAHMGGMQMGICIYWTATAIPSIKLTGDLGNLSMRDESWISSTNFLGAVAASPIAGVILERFGRRKSLILLTIPCAIGWILMACSINVYMMCIGRFITGICSFSMPLIVPVYVAEISEPEIRGMLISGYIIMANIAALFGYIMGSFLSWRLVTGSCTLIPVLGLVLMLVVPESPSYLVGIGKQNEAKKALMWLRGTKVEEHVNSEYTDLFECFNKRDDGKNSGWNWRYLKEASTLKPTLVGMLAVTLMQTTFYNVIMAATVQVFESTGSSSNNEYLYTVILGVVQLFASMVPSFVVDKVGRRVLILSGLCGIVLSIGSLGAYFHVKRIDEAMAHAYLSWLPLCCLIAYAIVESIGVSSIVYVIIGEITPPKTKGLSGAILGVWNGLSCFTVLFIFRDLLATFGNDGGYYFIAAVNFIQMVLVYLIVPETKGKSLDEINSFFSKE